MDIKSNNAYSIQSIKSPKRYLWQNGFTLIELLVVIAIIGVLGAGLVLIIDPLGQIRKAHDAHKKSDLAQIQTALEAYYQDFGTYPTAAQLTFNNTFTSGTQTYMTKVPQDPTAGYTYVYIQQNGGQGYSLYASLEAKLDANACNGGNVKLKCPNAGAANCGTGVCNYGVTSPNLSP